MSAPIGLFDSGLGGLTVLKKLERVLENESFIYLADTQNLPYGEKSSSEMIDIARRNAHVLLEKGIKLLVIPCHTASSHALCVLERELPIPVVGMTSACLDLMRPFQRIAILATESTIQSGIYQSLALNRASPPLLFPQACPLFVPLIEGSLGSKREILHTTLSPLRGKIDAALLACTHFPLIHVEIQQELGSEVTLLDPSDNTCELVKKRLIEKEILSRTKGSELRFFVTSEPEEFEKKARIFWEKVSSCKRL